MIVTYRCKCGHEFDGHWHEAPARAKQFPELSKKIKLDIDLAMVCPKCGNTDRKTNIDCDEDFTPEVENDDDNEEVD